MARVAEFKDLERRKELVPPSYFLLDEVPKENAKFRKYITDKYKHMEEVFQRSDVIVTDMYYARSAKESVNTTGVVATCDLYSYKTGFHYVGLTIKNFSARVGKLDVKPYFTKEEKAFLKEKEIIETEIVAVIRNKRETIFRTKECELSFVSDKEIYSFRDKNLRAYYYFQYKTENIGDIKCKVNQMPLKYSHTSHRTNETTDMTDYEMHHLVVLKGKSVHKVNTLEPSNIINTIDLSMDVNKHHLYDILSTVMVSERGHNCLHKEELNGCLELKDYKSEWLPEGIKCSETYHKTFEILGYDKPHIDYDVFVKIMEIGLPFKPFL